MPGYQTPGVYYERVDASSPTIPLLRMDIAGFVGISRRGPVDSAVPVQSWRQFLAYFGEFTGVGYLAYTVRAFFENEGQRCWVVRVGSETTYPAQAQLVDRFARPVWTVSASSPGTWGNRLRLRLVETHRAQTWTQPGFVQPEYASVGSVAGLERAGLVRLAQEGAPEQWKVINRVEAPLSRIYWMQSGDWPPLPYDSPLAGFDFNRPIRVESVEYTLLVWEAGRLVQTYRDLSLVRDHPRWGPGLLPPLQFAPERGLLRGGMRILPDAPEPLSIHSSQDFSDPQPLDLPQGGEIWLKGGADGLAELKADDFIGGEIDPFAEGTSTRGLRLLETVDEVAALAVPDIHIQPLQPAEILTPEECIPDPCLPPPPPSTARPRGSLPVDLPPVFSEAEIYQVQAAMVEQCERRRDRVALLDPPFRAATSGVLGVAAVRAWRQRFDSRYAAFYHPWLVVVDPLRLPGVLTRAIPPSGHVAGQIARTDFETGVHKAPANTALAWAQAPTLAVEEAVHGLLNEEGINVIRAFPGRGLRIFGARTISSDPDWRFLNVRRLLILIEKSIYVATQWAVFEPNETFTRTRLHMALSNFLLELWQRGALAGSNPTEAFFVLCDESNNPPSERGNGRLLAEVGVAPSYPFEFVVLRVGREGNSFEVSEAGMDSGGM